MEDNIKSEMTTLLAHLSFSSKSVYTAEMTACRNGALRAAGLQAMFAYTDLTLLHHQSGLVQYWHAMSVDLVARR